MCSIIKMPKLSFSTDYLMIRMSHSGHKESIFEELTIQKKTPFDVHLRDILLG